jgi:predicted XRE-type DNA-binding protein
MKNASAKPETHEFTRKNGHVFAQLGRPDADDLLRKTRVMNVINDVVKRRGLTQEAAAELAGVDQADVSRLANGRVSGFSLGRLMTIVDRLGIEIHFEQRRDERGHLVVNVREIAHERADP